MRPPCGTNHPSHQRRHFFFHTMCLCSKDPKIWREFIFVLKQQEKILTSRRATGGLQALTATLALTLTLGLTLIKTE